MTCGVLEIIRYIIKYVIKLTPINEYPVRRNINRAYEKKQKQCYEETRIRSDNYDLWANNLWKKYDL